MKLILNGETVQAEAPTLHDLLGTVPAGHAVAVNHEVVPRSQHRQRRLRQGDVVDVVSAVAGG